MASSFVRQNAWTDQLLKYRASGNGIAELRGSVRNAISYLRDPSSELTMLSEAHRQKVSENLLQKKYSMQGFIADVLEFFGPYQIRPANTENLTRIISNILYQPRVKRLWLPDSDESERVDDAVSTPPLEPDEVRSISWDDPLRLIATALRTK
ncbi:MAG: hypothetical protein ABIV48_03130, partial [Pyrinomonadaceae bacterium]